MEKRGSAPAFIGPLVLAALVVLGLVFRLAVVRAWHAPAGDGMDYYALSQELLLHGRYAYGPWPTPLSYTRMPGYPLFLAYLAVGKAPLGIESHLLRATLANVILDTGTAILCYLMLRRRGQARALVAALLVLLCPTLILLSCYGLGESLATFLTTLSVYLLWRGLHGRLLWHLGLAGLVLGLLLLTRADTVTLAPAVGLSVYAARQPLRRRLLALALCGLVAGAVFAPWPLRNYLRFGHAYASSWYWRTRYGAPLPMGFIRWARTFCAGEPGESFVDLRVTVRGPLDTEPGRGLLPSMYDSPAEQHLLTALFHRYNYEFLSPTVDAAFSALAAERARRAPLRTYVLLPLRRMLHLWSPVPEHELPMRVDFLDLPARRSLFGTFNRLLFAAAALGAVRLWWRGRRAALAAAPAAVPAAVSDARAGRYLSLMLVSTVVLRSVVLSLIVAFGLTQRHLVEVFPLLIILAASV